MPPEPPVEEVLDLLGDHYARTILAATDREPMTAGDLDEAYEFSRPTISRRVNRLTALGLLAERTHVPADGRHPVTVYEAALDGLVLQLEDGEFDLTLTRQRAGTDWVSRLRHRFKPD